MKKLILAFLSTALILSAMLSASALTLETVETNTAPAVVDAELTAAPTNSVLSMMTDGTFDTAPASNAFPRNWSIVEDPADATNKVLMISNPSSTSYANTYYNASIPLSADTDYMYTFKYKGSNAGVYGGTNFTDDNNASLSGFPFLNASLTTEWQEFSEIIRAEDITNATNGIWFYLSVNSGALYVDDFYLYPYEENTEPNPEPMPEEPAAESILPFDGKFNEDLPSGSYDKSGNVGEFGIVNDPNDATNKVLYFTSKNNYATFWVKTLFADNTDYKVSFDISGTGSWVGVFMHDNNNTVVKDMFDDGYLSNAATATSFVHKEITVTADQIATAKSNYTTPFWLAFQINTSGHTTYIDNLTITPIPTPTFSFDMLAKNAIREDGALRYISLIDLATAEADTTEEYGFIAARASYLNGAELTINTEKKITGVAYNKADGTNIYYSKVPTAEILEIVEGTNMAVTAVITGLPEDKRDEVITVRPYIKIDGITYYGLPRSTSYNNVANPQA